MKMFKMFAAACLVIAIGVPASAAVLYENGQPNGTFDALQISPPQSVSDSFTLSTAANLTGATVALWTAPGTTPASLTWMIGTTAFASDIGTGSATLSNTFFTANDISDVYLSSFSFALPVAAGSYWLTLGDGVNNVGGELFWDINFGPSFARFRDDTGEFEAIGSNYFAILGDEVTGPGPNPVPEPASLALLLIGAGGGALVRRAARRRAGA